MLLSAMIQNACATWKVQYHHRHIVFILVPLLMMILKETSALPPIIKIGEYSFSCIIFIFFSSIPLFRIFHVLDSMTKFINTLCIMTFIELSCHISNWIVSFNIPLYCSFIKLSDFIISFCVLCTSSDVYYIFSAIFLFIVYNDQWLLLIWFYFPFNRFLCTQETITLGQNSVKIFFIYKKTISIYNRIMSNVRGSNENTISELSYWRCLFYY